MKHTIIRGRRIIYGSDELPAEPRYTLGRYDERGN